MPKSLPLMLKSVESPWRAIEAAAVAARLAWQKSAAARNQRRYCGSYIAVTGSCGKSTTTMLIGKLLAATARTRISTSPNYGRHLLKLFRNLDAPVDYAVQEVSGDTPGALRMVTDTLRIDVAVVTSVGSDHASKFRHQQLSIPEAIAVEKGKLVEAVPPSGLACLNADDPLVRAMAERTRARVIRFGRAEDAEVRAVAVDAAWPARLHFTLRIGGRDYPVATRFVGTLMLPNVLAALSVVHGLGLDIDAAIRTLATVEPVEEHMSVHLGSDQRTYVLDTYKASYWSTERLVDDLGSLGRRDITFVLGNVSDILSERRRRVRGLLRRLAASVDHVVATGDAARYAPQLHLEGLSNIVVAETREDVAAQVARHGQALVIVKSNCDLNLAPCFPYATPLRHEGAYD